MANMNFTLIKQANTDYFLSLIDMARIEKLSAKAILKVSNKGNRVNITIWRLCGGTDMFGVQKGDIFDKVSVSNECVSWATIGSVIRTQLLSETGDILLTDETIREENLPKIISKISKIYGYIASENDVSDARYTSISSLSIEI